MADYGQLFCEAVDTIVQERLSGIKFDNTIVGIIVDDKDKAQGKYVVSYGQAKFEAYSLNDVKYNIHNNVYVQIPQGDWNEQKFIIGRKADDENVPVNYQYPFDSFIDITGNLLVNTPNITSGLIANGLYDNNELKKGSDSEIIWSYNIPKPSEDDTVERPFGEQFSKYTRLGIQAQFRSWLAEDQAVSGSYGLRLRIEAEREDQQDIDLKNQDEGAGSVEVSTETVYYDLLLDAADMIGNPYSFDTYFQQEKLFDISDIYRINKMELQFYQKGDFKNKEGIVFDPYQDSNLFVKDIYISLGYDANNFENDTAMIYSFDSSKYTTIANPAESNHKKIQIRWIHRLENNVIKSIDITDQIDYTITWYKYKLGAYSYTPQSGPDWIPLSSQTVKWNAVNDELNRSVEFKILDQNWLDYNVNADIKYYREPGFNYTWLLPDVTESEEYIKAIISYTINDKAVYVKSDPLKFTNREPVVSKPTVDAVSALSIVCEDNSFGNYRIYNQGNELLNPADGQVERIFTAYFKGAPLSNAEEIEWIIPTQNSMIVLENEYYSPDRSWDDTGRVHLKRYGDKAKKYDISQVNNQRYKIKRYFNQTSANNIIQCKIKKDNITYTATKELTFGVAGTNGSDHTLIIDFDDGFTAIPYLISDLLKQGKPNFEKVKSPLVKEQYYGLTARLYDFENKEIDFSSIANYTIEWGFEIAPKTNSALSFKNETTYIEVIKRDEDGNPLYKDKDKTEYQYDSIPDSTGSKKNLYVDYTKLNMNQLYIVKATLRWRDAQSVKVEYKDENGKTQNKDIKPQILTAFLPIPIYKYFETEAISDTGLEHIIQPAFIGGATQVVYMSSGYPNYYKDAYQIFYNEYNEFEDKTLTIKKTEEWKNDISWYVIGQSKAALDKYAPECATDGNLTKQKNCLKPSGIYIKDADPYGVQCKLKGDPIWTQPIFVTMNRYPNSMINKWDGKTLTLNEDSGSILSTAIAAGKKETWTDNNREQTAFTGVMLGDWSSSTLGDIEESLVKTGIYGFHRGEQSFAFTEDGKAFIGKAGKGRIHLDGDKSTIESEAWKDDNKVGMSLDLDDGILDMRSKNKTGNILISADEATYPLSIGSTSTSVGARPFRVTWDGHLYAKNATIIGTIKSSNITATSTINGATIIGATIQGGSMIANELYAGSMKGYAYYRYSKKADGTWDIPTNTDNREIYVFADGPDVLGYTWYNHEDLTKATARFDYLGDNNGGLITEETKTCRLGSFRGGIETVTENADGSWKKEIAPTTLVGLTTHLGSRADGTLTGVTNSSVPIVISSAQRLGLFSDQNIMMKGTMIHIWYSGSGNNGTFRLDGFPADKQYGIYARFA